MLRALVLVDYQNIHLTAHEHWSHGSAKHETLVHPLYFGIQAIGQRNYHQKLAERDVEPAELAQVVVYRGLPSNQKDSKAYGRSMAQKSHWTRDSRVEVNYRPLRYYWEGGKREAREKGIDVLLALNLVRAAREGEYGLVVLASHDTDLEPAIDEAALLAPSCILETVGWQNSKRLRPRTNGLWHTFLGEKEFTRTVDRTDYS